MKKILLLALSFLSLVNYNSQAQYTLVKPNGYLETSGYFLGYYNYRQYPSGTTNFKNNTFAMDYAVLDFNGMYKKIWHYEFKMNTVAFVVPGTDDGAIMEANMSYNSLNDALMVKFGYSKLPFNRSSMLENIEFPYFERPDMDRGSVYNRRDMGVTVRYSLWNKKINLYAGAYDGVGTSVLLGKNDASGNLEFVGRAEFSYPARYRNSEVDLVQLQVPVIAFGVDGRYSNKQSPMSGDSTLMIDGISMGTSANVDFMYKGLSAHFEVLRFKMQPRNTDTVLLQGKPTNYLLKGGVAASINYFIKPLNTIVAVRYDQYNPTDLYLGDMQQTVSYCMNYMFDGQKAMIKAQYWQRIKDPNSSAVWKPNEFRIGFQLMF